jgi:hypothetical protein
MSVTAGTGFGSTVSGVHPKTTSRGDRYWRDSDGQLHREDGPAVIYADGQFRWYRHGRLHREDGPAYLGDDGQRVWVLDGAVHRMDGPAYEFVDGTYEWWVRGVQLPDPTDALTSLDPALLAIVLQLYREGDNVRDLVASAAEAVRD